jgi:hypothetical protein
VTINIRGFEFEAASSWDSGEDWHANVSTTEIDGEWMVEIRTTGPVDQVCLPEHVQTIRLSRNALQQLVGFAKMLDAQAN